MSTTPTSLALTNIADNSQIVASTHRNNYSAVQTAVNALISFLSGGTSGQVVQSGGGTTINWAAPTISRSPYNTLIDVASSTTETDVLQAAGYALAGGTLTSTGYLRVKLWGDVLYNNNTADTLVTKVYFGGAAIFAGAADTIGALNANRHSLYMEFDLANIGATNSQVLGGFWILGSGSAPTTGVIGASVSANLSLTQTGESAFSATAAVDTTSAQTLRVTHKWSANSANNSFRIRRSLIEIYP